MHARNRERQPEAGGARRWRTERHHRPQQGLQPAAQIGEHLIRHAGAGPASIKELAVIGVIAEQERAEVRPRTTAMGG